MCSVTKMMPKAGFPTPESPVPPPAPSMRVGLYAEDRMLVLDGPSKDGRGAFLRRPDGSIGWLRFAGRVFVRQGLESA